MTKAIIRINVFFSEFPYLKKKYKRLFDNNKLYFRSEREREKERERKNERERDRERKKERVREREFCLFDYRNKTRMTSSIIG